MDIGNPTDYLFAQRMCLDHIPTKQLESIDDDKLALSNNDNDNGIYGNNNNTNTAATSINTDISSFNNSHNETILNPEQ